MPPCRLLYIWSYSYVFYRSVPKSGVLVLEEEVDSNSPDPTEKQVAQPAPSSADNQTEASSESRESNDSVKDLTFEYNYDRRNSQMHNSLTDVKVVFDYPLAHRDKA